MALLLFALAIVWIVFGAGLIVNTQGTRAFYQRIVPSDKLRTYAIPALVVGGLLIVGALVSDRMFWWPFLLGLIAVAKGVYLFRAEEAQLQAVWTWWCEEVSEDSLRLRGLVIYSLGAALLGYLF